MANTGYLIGGIVIGAFVGGAGAYMLTKKKLEQDYQVKIDQLTAEFAKLDPYGPGNYGKVETKKSEPVKIDPRPEFFAESPSEAEIASAVREFKREVKPTGKTDYTAAFDGVPAAEKQTSVGGVFDLIGNAEEVTDEEGDDDEDESNTTVHFHSNTDLHSDPSIISADEASTVPDEYDTEVLYYYVQNDVVVDDFDEVIDEPEKSLGNLLESSGFKTDLNRHLYIKNPRLCVIFNIQKVFKPWEGKM